MLDAKANMRPSPDENLPEVVPPQPFEADGGSSPQVVSQGENANHAWDGSERDKYPVIYDTTPKYVDDAPKIEGYGDAASPQPWSPESLQTVSPSTAVATLSKPSEPPQPPKDERTIWGLRRRTFFILAGIISIILLAAIIGGAVGGTVTKKSSDSASAEAQSASQQTASSSTKPAATTSQTTTTSSAPSSTSSQPTSTLAPTLNNSTAPRRGLAFQAFQLTSYLGTASSIIQEEGFHDLNMTAKSYVWMRDDTDCCLTFCTNKTSASGYWCDTRYRPDASEGFARVSIWCGGNDGRRNVTCS